MMFSQEILALVWFLLLGLLLCGYAVLDGFDLGVGILHPFVARDEKERRASMDAIGPLWDGNEVWLVVFGGAMFAMYPELYASVFSGFYLALMALLFALIFRAISFEFRGKVHNAWWRALWDYAFFTGSCLATFLFGIAVGNVVRGISLDPAGNFTLPFLEQLNPFSLLIGALAVLLFAMHGALYLHLKTDGEFQDHIYHTSWTAFGLFLVSYILATIFALSQYPHILRNFDAEPALWIVPVLHVLALANIPRTLYRHEPAFAFASSCVCIATLVGLLGIALFPYVLFDPATPANSLTYLSAASSEKTLAIGLLFVALGMPFVLGYTALIYRTFWGKVGRTY